MYGAAADQRGGRLNIKHKHALMHAISFSMTLFCARIHKLLQGFMHLKIQREGAQALTEL